MNTSLKVMVQIDMAVWTYSILRDLKPELLQNFPASKARAVSSGQNGAAAQEGSNGKVETDNCDKEELTGAGVTEPSARVRLQHTHHYFDL